MCPLTCGSSGNVEYPVLVCGLSFLRTPARSPWDMNSKIIHGADKVSVTEKLQIENAVTSSRAIGTKTYCLRTEIEL